MRAGGAATPHALSPESASVLRLSLSLARRRGHAQVTPLHVAATLLTTGFLRAACLKTHPDHRHRPLQCRALELCFNVALNRLPATTAQAPPIHAPALSNALIAALKRAQVHHRRGCIENQNHPPPPITAVKFEQLILSILDDPGVSRVMKEAGFSSAAVKNSLQDSNPAPTDEFTNHNFFPKPPNWQNPFQEDINSIFRILLDKKTRNPVIIGDTISMSETLISHLMTKLDSGDVPDALKPARFLELHLSSVPLRFMSIEDINTNLSDLKKKVETLLSSHGKVIIYTGDLHWAADDDRSKEYPSGHVCNSTDHFITEMGKLVSRFNATSDTRVWLMAVSGYQTYMKCKQTVPSLNVQWSLQAVAVPSTGLGLSLNASASYEKDAVFRSAQQKSFPQDKDELAQLRRKLCQSLHQGGLNRPGSGYASSDHRCTGRNYCYCLSYPHSPHRNVVPADSDKIPSAYYKASMHRFEDGGVKTALSLRSYAPPGEQMRTVYEDLLSVLRENVPWQSDAIPLIVEALMDGCEQIDGNRFLAIEGNDAVGIRRLAAGIAKAVFGSSDMLIVKEAWNGINLEKALRDHDRGVVLIKGADPELMRFLADSLDSDSTGHTIFILTRDSDACCEKAGDSVIQMKLLVQEHEHGPKTPNLDLKRKADWAAPTRGKHPRNDDMDEVSSDRDRGCARQCFTSKAFDLNIMADEEDKANHGMPGQLSPISSDLTREPTATDQQWSPHNFPKTFKNRFVFNRAMDQEECAKQMFSLKLGRTFEESIISHKFNIDNIVLDEVIQGMGSYLNCMFEGWVRDVFRPSLRTIGERGKVSVRLCLGLGGNNGDQRCVKDGYKGTCLPKRIPVCYTG